MAGQGKSRTEVTDRSSEYPPIDGGVIQSVVLVDQLARPVASAFQATSGPGHLLHFVVEGEVIQYANGQQQHLVPGTCVWYHENEAVQGRILKTPWTYYTVCFLASRLPPPPFEKRVWRPRGDVAGCFQELLDAWRHVSAPPIVRHMRVIERLLRLVLEAGPAISSIHRVDTCTHLWWDIEAKVRQDLSQPTDMKHLQSLARRNKHSIIRACHSAVGTAPMKRIKEIRLSYARSLVLYSQLPMTEVALRVGYSRVQELSRDYHKKYGATPTDDREAGPDYQKLQLPGD